MRVYSENGCVKIRVTEAVTQRCFANLESLFNKVATLLKRDSYTGVSL